MVRLFISIKIPGEVKDKLLDVCYELSESSELFKWEKPEKIHLTLKFIGEVEEEIVSSIAKEIAFVEEYNSFYFNVTKFGFFFRKGVPSILWVELQTDESIHSFVDKLGRRYQSAGPNQTRSKRLKIVDAFFAAHFVFPTR